MCTPYYIKGTNCYLNMDANRKHQRTTQQQLQFYICFCKEHPELQAGKKVRHGSARQMQQLWAELAEKLNAMRGPTRTPEKWRANLNQWKHQIRCRARKVEEQQRPSVTELSEAEQLALYGDKDAITLGFDTVFGPSFDSKSVKADRLLHVKDEKEFLATDTNNSTPVEDYSSATEEVDSNRSTLNSSSSAAFRVTPQLLYEELRKSNTKREEMQERMLQQQAETNAALRQMSEAVLALAQAIAKCDNSKTNH